MPGERELTRFLQEYGLPVEHSTLMPCHTVPQLIDTDLLPAKAPAHSRGAHLCRRPVGQRNRDHSAAPTSARVCVVVVVAVEEAGPVARWRRVLHLHWEPGARVHGVALTEGIGNLVCVDRIEGYADADSLILGWVVDNDEFTFLGLGYISKEGDAVIIFGFGSRGNSVGVVGNWCSGIVHCWSHGGPAYGWVWWVTTRVAWEDMTLSDILW